MQVFRRESDKATPLRTKSCSMGGYDSHDVVWIARFALRNIGQLFVLICATPFGITESEL